MLSVLNLALLFQIDHGVQQIVIALLQSGLCFLIADAGLLAQLFNLFKIIHVSTPFLCMMSALLPEDMPIIPRDS